ncbi:MAG: septum formation protein [Planctomycetaceae bacterium]|jgi:septum formation protein
MTDSKTDLPIVIGSRSPRRLELLQMIAAPERLVVLPPRDADEPGFDGLKSMSEFETRCHEIVELKRQDVVDQLVSGAAPNGPCVVICADTTVIAEDVEGSLLALGQPNVADDWEDEVRGWFRDCLAGRTHTVLSAVSVTLVDKTGTAGKTLNQSCETRVTMRDDVEHWLDWYISTGEPVGKAGGYAIQGAGSVMVTKVEGSYSNVVGLPIEDTVEMLRKVGALSLTDEQR